MRKAFLALAVLASSAAATPPIIDQPPPAPPPRLLIVISVDQLSADLWDEYRPHFTGGLARLAGGTAFRNGYQSHATTETCPGHSTILTGARPSRTGIVANQWPNQGAAREDKTIYCAEDERVPGSSSEKYVVSPVHLRVPTLGDLMKRANPASRVVAVGGKDRSAVMMGGRAPDQRWYWDGKALMSDLAHPVPRSVAAAQAAFAAALAAPQLPLDAPPLCTAKARPIAVGNRTVGNGRFARDGGDRSAFRASPQFDGAMLAVSAALTGELQLGRDNVPDLLAISLAATDYLGHGYGTGGQEMCLQLLSLDRDLGDFFAALDAQGLDYAVALTADHGGLDLPERARLAGVGEAARVDAALTASAIGRALGERLKLPGPVLLGDVAGDIYMDRALTAAQRLRVREAALAAYRAHPQVEAVFTREDIAAAQPAGSPDRWTLQQRLRASFDPERSGDIFVVLKRNVTPIARPTSAVATHGSPWDYDRRVPILFWRRGNAALSSETAIETVDIMPTLAAMVGIPVPAGSIDGRCLREVRGVACPAR